MVSTERFYAIRHDDPDFASCLWDRFEADGFATAFQTRSWIKAIRETLIARRGADLFMVEVREVGSEKPLMLLPFCRWTYCGLRVVEFVSLGVSDLAMPVMAAEDAVAGTAEAQSLWQVVLAVLPKADLVKIDQIPPQYRGRENPLALLIGVMPAPQMRYEAPLSGEAPRVIEAMASTKMRQNLKRSERRLSDYGKIQFLAAESEQETEVLLSAMFQQRRERFRALGRYDLMAQPEVQDFYRTVARQRLDGAGIARLWGLLVDGEPVATCLALVHANTLHCLVITMKGPPWERCSPALVLISRLLVWCRENKVTLIDFSVGEGYHKTGFGGKPQMMLRHQSALSLRGKAVLLAMTEVERGKAWIQRHPRLFETARDAVRRGRRLFNRRVGQEPSSED